MKRLIAVLVTLARFAIFYSAMFAMLVAACAYEDHDTGTTIAATFACTLLWALFYLSIRKTMRTPL